MKNVHLINLYSQNFSAKSRIKGTLEIYHAFVHEQREQADSTPNSGDWEHVENVPLTGTAQVENEKFH